MFFLHSFLIDILSLHWLDYSFMRNALLALLLISPIFGLVSTVIVNNKMSFFSDALSHCAFTGIAIGSLIGVKNQMLVLIGFGILFAFFVSSTMELDTASEDSIINVFSSAGLALGMLILSFNKNFYSYSFLIGDVLSIGKVEIWCAVFLFFFVLTTWFFLFNKLMFSSIDRDLAQSKNVNYKLYKQIFVIIIALIVAISINLIGVLLINSLLTLPAAAAKNIAKNIRSYHILSVVFSMTSCLLGLIISFYIGTSASGLIVLIAVLLFFLTFIINMIRSFNF